MSDGFIEAGTGEVNLLASINTDELKITDNKKYLEITRTCSDLHKQLLKYETNNELTVENPALIGNALGKLRLNCNLLFSFLNIYIDIASDIEMEYAKKRQQLYITTLAGPKGSVSSAEKHAREMTRVDEATHKMITSTIMQIKNDYERYNSICMYVQSRLKEFISERLMN